MVLEIPGVEKKNDIQGKHFRVSPWNKSREKYREYTLFFIDGFVKMDLNRTGAAYYDQDTETTFQLPCCPTSVDTELMAINECCICAL